MIADSIPEAEDVDSNELEAHSDFAASSSVRASTSDGNVSNATSIPDDLEEYTPLGDAFDEYVEPPRRRSDRIAVNRCRSDGHEPDYVDYGDRSTRRKRRKPARQIAKPKPKVQKESFTGMQSSQDLDDEELSPPLPDLMKQEPTPTPSEATTNRKPSATANTPRVAPARPVPARPRTQPSIDLTRDEHGGDADVKAEPAPVPRLGSKRERRVAGKTTEVMEEEDEEDMEDELKEIQLRRKLRAFKKRKLAAVGMKS